MRWTPHSAAQPGHTAVTDERALPLETFYSGDKKNALCAQSASLDFLNSRSTSLHTHSTAIYLSLHRLHDTLHACTWATPGPRGPQSTFGETDH